MLTLALTTDPDENPEARKARFPSDHTLASSAWRTSATFRAMRSKVRIVLGFTLVELLVVIGIFLTLAGIALPIVRNLLVDQKASKAARNIASFFEVSRSRAIAEGRAVGVRIERLSPGTAGISYQTSASIRLRQLISVPPYSGDASNARARLSAVPSTGPINRAEFDVANAPLLKLAFDRLTNTEPMPSTSYDTTDDHLSPIRIGDLLELPGGRTVPLMLGHDSMNPRITFTTTPVDRVTIAFDLSEGRRFPINSRVQNITSGDPVAFKIHRSPIVSSAAPMNFPRGVAIDLNYSGFGPRGVEFAPGTGANFSIDLMFSPDGSISTIRAGSDQSSFPPPGLIFLCLGSTDGVRPDSLFATGKREAANIMRLETLWLVINPSTGRVSVAPNASVSSTASVADAVDDGRTLALLADTVDGEP